jgi:DNA-binding response OmpR family regulator
MKAVQDLAGRATRSVVLALPDMTGVADRLRRTGWRVYPLSDANALRRLTCRMTPDVVVLPAAGSDESGWLTCAKLLRANPRLRVIVVGEQSPETAQMARFVGAEMISSTATADELAELIDSSVFV